MSAEQPVRVWTANGFEAVETEVGEPLAADSWLVVDGRVLAWQLHQLRFADAVVDAGGDRRDALSAARAAMRLVPEGRWSPRLDLTREGLFLRVRPVPLQFDRVEVVTAHRDPRSRPLRKGPDLEALGRLQEEETARVGAAVEPVLLSRGLVAEGAWSAVLWWQDDALHVPEQDVVRLPSVTAAVIEQTARLDGVEVRRLAARPADLEGCEVWLANALRGIRGVTAWHGGPAVAPPLRVAAWRARLEQLRTRPITGRP